LDYLSQVKGNLQGERGKLVELSSQLRPLGYDTTIIGNQLELTKGAQIESVVNELVPLLEKKGWNTADQLKLEEYGPEETVRNVYDRGRIVREFPRGV